MSLWSLPNSAPARCTIDTGTANTLLKNSITTVANDTKSAYTELSSSTPHNFEGFWFHVHTDQPPNDVGGGARSLFDIAIGSAGNEEIIVENLLWGHSSTTINAAFDIFIPLRIPAGTRMAVRLQTAVSGEKRFFEVSGLAKGLAHQPIFNKCVSTTLTQPELDDTVGRKFDTSNTANQFGAFVSLGTFPSLKAFMFSVGEWGSPTPPLGRLQMNLGIGAGGSQVEIYEGIFSYNDDNGIRTPPYTPLFYTSIPPDELWVKGRSNLTSRPVDVNFHGFY